MKTYIELFKDEEIVIHIPGRDANPYYYPLMHLLDDAGLIWIHDRKAYDFVPGSDVYLKISSGYNGRRFGTTTSPNGLVVIDVAEICKTPTLFKLLSGECSLSTKNREQKDLIIEILKALNFKGCDEDSLSERYKSVPYQAIDFCYNPGQQYIVNGAPRPNKIKVEDFISENFKFLLPKMIEIKGDAILKEAAYKQLRQNGFSMRSAPGTTGNPTHALYVDEEDKTVCFTQIANFSSRTLTLPQDWDKLKELKPKNAVKSIEVNGYTLSNRELISDGLFRVEGETIITNAAWNHFQKIWEGVVIADLHIVPEVVSIGCTRGFTLEHFKKIKTFVESLKQ